MIALVLAAGYATRLYPLTERFPKPLLPVAGKPILDWLLDDLDAAGCVSRYAVIGNHRYAAHFAAWAEGAQKRLSAPITVLDDGSESNDTRLGAVRDLHFAIESLGCDDDLLVLAGDNVLDFSLRCFPAYFAKKRATCVMRHFEPDAARLSRTGVLELGEDDLVLGMEEKPAAPRSHWAVPPFYIYAKSDARLVGAALSEGCAADAPGSFIAWLCKRRPVYAMEMPGSRFDVGTLEAYRAIDASYRGITRQSAPMR